MPVKDIRRLDFFEGRVLTGSNDYKKRIHDIFLMTMKNGRKFRARFDRDIAVGQFIYVYSDELFGTEEWGG